MAWPIAVPPTRIPTERAKVPACRRVRKRADHRLSTLVALRSRSVEVPGVVSAIAGASRTRTELPTVGAGEALRLYRSDQGSRERRRCSSIHCICAARDIQRGQPYRITHARANHSRCTARRIPDRSTRPLAWAIGPCLIADCCRPRGGSALPTLSGGVGSARRRPPQARSMPRSSLRPSRCQSGSSGAGNWGDPYKCPLAVDTHPPADALGH